MQDVMCAAYVGRRVQGISTTVDAQFSMKGVPSSSIAGLAGS